MKEEHIMEHIMKEEHMTFESKETVIKMTLNRRTKKNKHDNSKKNVEKINYDRNNILKKLL